MEIGKGSGGGRGARRGREKNCEPRLPVATVTVSQRDHRPGRSWSIRQGSQVNGQAWREER